MKGHKISLEDLLLDESFMRYALGYSPTDQDQWNLFTKLHPELTDLIIQAHEIITFISSRHAQAKHPEISDNVFNRLKQQIAYEKARVHNKSRKITIRAYWYAASLIFFVAVSIFFLLNRKSVVTLSENKFLEIIVPEGQRSQLILPDGSKVWLNSGTCFKYPVSFLNGSRDVFLNGEAYFEVRHRQNNMPFLVHLNENLQISVLGTEFNVKSYDVDKVIEATLVNGSIRMIREGTGNHVVQEIIMKPNEKAIYKKQERQLFVTTLVSKAGAKMDMPVQNSITKNEAIQDEMEALIAWKDEALIFHDETFEDLAVRMERWFGMKITIGDELLRKERFTGKFVNNESIYQILDIFNRSESIQYTIKNKEIIITKKNN